MNSPPISYSALNSRRMVNLRDRSVQLVVTSPPYNVGIAYANHSDDLPLAEYLAFLNEVWRECYRVLTPGGRLCINVANTDRKPYLPLNTLITAELLRMAARRGVELADARRDHLGQGRERWRQHRLGQLSSSSDPVFARSCMSTS